MEMRTTLPPSLLHRHPSTVQEATGELIEPSMVGGWTWWTEDPEPFCIPAHGRNSTAPTTNSFPYLVVINYGDALAQDKQCSIDHEADAPAT
ncbi:uncharacterized protein LOC103627159 [Zea mays]|uniref:uncharacterized protein LOC103627159 n=1 Tax=Zea mays TaxID=4577 RepID=UPI000221FA6C|nr:uncharacterized protein LOC103627159 [Zea mays]|eukprot:XP_008645687.1 uncharacterized protein LOC103627159 isoform X2 [Zea mays]